MAVEINKRLHRHALKASIVTAGLLLALGWGLQQYKTADTTAWRALVTRVISVKPTSNGLGKVSVSEELKPTANTGTFEAIQSTGQTAQLIIMLEP